MSAEVDLIGHQARSREGRGLSVRSGDSDKWITIQKNTFMNWVNLQLQGSGHVVDNFETDFDDGVKLCALVEALQRRKIGKVSEDWTLYWSVQFFSCCFFIFLFFIFL